MDKEPPWQNGKLSILPEVRPDPDKVRQASFENLLAGMLQNFPKLKDSITPKNTDEVIIATLPKE